MNILIKNGFLVDPANGISSKQNIVIENGKVLEITRDEPKCDEEIDAKGKIVAPGFIDIHMHEEGWKIEGEALSDSVLLAMLRMGVTTAIGGNCGDNYADPVEYLDFADEKGIPVNVGLYAGHTYFRNKAGHQDKYTNVSDEELNDMQNMMKDAVSQGLLGISLGIRYIPGTDQRELDMCANLCRETGKLLTAHIRDDADNVFGALDEFIELGTKYKIPLQISHIGSMAAFGQMKGFIEKVDCYRANGFDFTCDCYPYDAFSTEIGATTYDDGWLERYDAKYEDLLICEGKYKGQRATEEIFRELRKDAPKTLTVCYVMKRDDVDLAMMHPSVILASDGLLNGGKGHPRASGTFPRYIKEYVRSGKVSLYDAIRKMTYEPAKKLGLENKGRLNKGADGDVVIFDIDKIADKAIFEEPMLMPEGIEYVIVNGKVACINNEVIDSCLGRSVRSK